MASDPDDKSAKIGNLRLVWRHAAKYPQHIAAAVFFLVVKPVNKLMERFKTQPDVESPTKSCMECLSDIPSGAKRCAFCTSPQIAA